MGNHIFSFFTVKTKLNISVSQVLCHKLLGYVGRSYAHAHTYKTHTRTHTHKHTCYYFNNNHNTHTYIHSGFPLFSSHEIPWLFQYFCHFSLTFFPRLQKANDTYLWLQMRLLFQAKTARKLLKYIKMLYLPPIFTDNEHVFHNVELILNKTMSENNCF